MSDVQSLPRALRVKGDTEGGNGPTHKLGVGKENGQVEGSNGNGTLQRLRGPESRVLTFIRLVPLSLENKVTRTPETRKKTKSKSNDIKVKMFSDSKL